MQRLRGLGVKLLILLIGGLLTLAFLLTVQMTIALLRVRDQALLNANQGLEDQSRIQLPILHEQLAHRIQERLITISDGNLSISRAMLSTDSQDFLDTGYEIPLTLLPNGARADTRPGRITSVYVPTEAVTADLNRDLRFSAILDSLLPQQLLTKEQNILAMSFIGPSRMIRIYPTIDVQQHDFAMEQALLTESRDTQTRARWLQPFAPPVFINTVDRQITAIVTPIYAAREFRGILIAYVSLGSLTADLIGIQPTGDSQMFLIGNQREIIAASQRFVPLWTDQSPNSVSSITKTLSPAFDTIINNMIAKNEGIEEVRLRDRDYLVTYQPIAETGWSLGLAVPFDELTRSTQTMSAEILQTSQATLLTTIGITIVLVLMAMLIGGYFSRRLTRPLGEVAKAAHAIAEGDYSQSVQIHSNDEIGEVAAAFNSMSRSIVTAQQALQAQNRQLEETVHARTADLEATVAQLQTAIDRQSELDQQLRRLSTPVIPVVKGVLMMPLVGSLDPQRVQQGIHDLLETVQTTQTHEVIIDITGVPSVSGDVAAVLVHAALALRMLGAETILTGVRPDVAEILIALDADLGLIQPIANLQEAVRLAFKRTTARN